MAGVLGFALNSLTVPVFGGTVLAFGGWVILLTAYLFGPWYGGIAAIIAFSRTWLDWNHPMGLICYTLEAVVSGWLVQRRGMGALISTCVYWLVVGTPLIAIYSFWLSNTPSPTNLVWVVKYPLNGLIMAMLAMLLYHSFRIRQHTGIGAAPDSNTPLETVLFRRFGVIAVLSIVTLSLYAGQRFDASLRQQTEKDLLHDARHFAYDIESYLALHQRALRTEAEKIAQSGTSPASIAGSLDILRSNYPGFLSLLVADQHGNLLATSPELRNDSLQLPGLPQQISDRDYFREPLASGRPFISNVFRGRGLGQDLIIALSCPVVDAKGKTIKIIEGSLRLTDLGKILNQPDNTGSRTVVIVDQMQRVIVSSGDNGRLPALRNFQHEQLYDAANLAGDGKIFLYNREIAGSSPVRDIGTSYRIPSSGWQIYLAEPLWNTQQAIASYYLTTGVGSALLIGLALLLSRDTATEITRPLKQLVAATRRIASDQPDPTPAEVMHSSRELSEISRDLQEAAIAQHNTNTKLSAAVQERDLTHRQLRQVLLHLDDKVRDRTSQLEQARKVAESANEAKSEFLASMSHELRTPLNVILGMTEILGERTMGPLNDRQAECISAVDESGRHLLSLINDILDLSKIEADMLHLDIQETEIQPVCDASLRFVQEAAMKKKVTLHRSYKQLAESMPADQRRLKQMLVNLLSNAVKFTPAGGSVTLEVTQDDSSDTLAFAVIDTGIGIAPEHIDKLFRPFQQIDSALNRSYSGTGLGLALVKRMAEMHGGVVGVASVPGKGSRFHIMLPLYTTEESENAKATSQATPLLAPAMPEASITGQPLILIAEDNETNVQLYLGHLRSTGCRFCFAQNGLEAIERAIADKPDLVLMDVQMPEMDGLTATRRLRADPRTAHLPIITVTALATAEDRLRCLEAGANAYLSKPVSLRELSRLIAEHLQSRPTTSPIPS